MSRTLLISTVTKDLVIQAGSPVMVEGSQKVEQGIRAVIIERLGTDHLHPSWGSTIPDLVGQVDDPNVLAAEIRRRLNLALRTYTQELVDHHRDRQIYATSAYDRSIMDFEIKSELIQTLDSVTVQVNGRQVDIRVIVTTAANESVDVAETLTIGA